MMNSVFDKLNLILQYPNMGPIEFRFNYDTLFKIDSIKKSFRDMSLYKKDGLELEIETNRITIDFGSKIHKLKGIYFYNGKWTFELNGKIIDSSVIEERIEIINGEENVNFVVEDLRELLKEKRKHLDESEIIIDGYMYMVSGSVLTISKDEFSFSYDKLTNRFSQMDKDVTVTYIIKI